MMEAIEHHVNFDRASGARAREYFFGLPQETRARFYFDPAIFAECAKTASLTGNIEELGIDCGMEGTEALLNFLDEDTEEAHALQ